MAVHADILTTPVVIVIAPTPPMSSTVHVSMLTRPVAIEIEPPPPPPPPDLRPDIPQYSQRWGISDNFNWQDGPNLKQWWSVHPFVSNHGTSGLRAEVTEFQGLAWTPVGVGDSTWNVITSPFIAWMNYGRRDQTSQIGVLDIPQNGGLICALTNCTPNGLSNAPWQGAYALIAESQGYADGTADLTIELLRFGRTLGLNDTSGNGPERIKLVDCGRISASFATGGSLIHFQSRDLGNRWELAAWAWEGYYLTGGDPHWHFQGWIEDDRLGTEPVWENGPEGAGVPGWGVSNVPGTTSTIHIDDVNIGWERSPWPLYGETPDPALHWDYPEFHSPSEVPEE